MYQNQVNIFLQLKSQHKPFKNIYLLFILTYYTENKKKNKVHELDE